jgi:hypothetical protein
LHRCAQHHAANAAKSVDADPCGHGSFAFVGCVSGGCCRCGAIADVTIVCEFMKLCYMPCASHGIVLVL